MFSTYALFNRPHQSRRMLQKFNIIQGKSVLFTGFHVPADSLAIDNTDIN